ncbi:hypothetical protein [Clostridium sp.]|uniref:hypothetical protein n=1 Tax=Clostridium sp. TaxID=1506 RepID=UPI0025C0D691|nr:hypothetical protein [Clostridium sp.]
MKFKLEDLIRVLNVNVLENDTCVEMNFSIDDDLEYGDCWLGKTSNNDNNKEIYWYGLVEDGSQAYNYDYLEELLSAKVFKGNNIRDIWERVTWYSLNGCDVEEMLEYI